MIETFGLSLASVIVVSALSFAGVFTFSLREKSLKAMVFVLVAVSAGALFGDAFLHLVPEAFEEGDPQLVAIMLVSGVMLFFVLEKFLAWHHRHGIDEESLETVKAHNHAIKPLGPVVLFADAIHNFIDGIVIAASFLVSPEVGFATTVAVVLHEIPQEIGDFGLLLHSGYSRAKALLFNFISALTAVVGVFFVFLLGERASELLPYMLGFTAGGFIYIAAADLVPEIQKTRGLKKSLLQVLCMTLGLALMIVLLYLE